MDRWRGRVAVVTGASAGIGAAICKLLANDGMKVVGCARRLEKVEELAKENSNIFPVKVKKNLDIGLRQIFNLLFSMVVIWSVNLYFSFIAV